MQWFPLLGTMIGGWAAAFFAAAAILWSPVMAAGCVQLQTLRHTKRCGKPNAAAYQMLQTDADRIFAAVASEETPAVLWSLFWWLFAFIKHIADQMLRNDADRVCSCCPVMMLVQVQAQTQSKQKTWLVIRTASSVFFSIGPQGRVSLHAESTVVQCHAHTHTHAHTHIYTNTHTHTHIHQNGT